MRRRQGRLARAYKRPVVSNRILSVRDFPLFLSLFHDPPRQDSNTEHGEYVCARARVYIYKYICVYRMADMGCRRVWEEGVVDRGKKISAWSSVRAIFQLIDGKNDRAPSLAQIFDNIFIVACVRDRSVFN